MRAGLDIGLLLRAARDDGLLGDSASLDAALLPVASVASASDNTPCREKDISGAS